MWYHHFNESWHTQVNTYWCFIRKAFCLLYWLKCVHEFPARKNDVLFLSDIPRMCTNNQLLLLCFVGYRSVSLFISLVHSFWRPLYAYRSILNACIGHNQVNSEMKIQSLLILIFVGFLRWKVSSLIQLNSWLKTFSN